MKSNEKIQAFVKKMVLDSLVQNKDLQSSISPQPVDATKLQTMVDSLKKMEETNAEAAKKDEPINAMASQEQQYYDLVGELNNDLAAAEVRVGELKNNLAAAEAKVEELDGNENVEGSIVAAKAKVEELKNNLDKSSVKVENDLALITDVVKKIQTNLEDNITAQQLIDKLKQQLNLPLQPLTICDQPENGEAVAENNLMIARNNLMIAMLENPKVLTMMFVANTDGSKLSLKTAIDPKALLGIIENDTSLLKLFIKVTAAVLALAALGVAITAGVAILAPIGIVTAAGVGAGTLALGAGGVAAFAGVGAYIVDTGGEMKQSFVQMEKAKEEVAKSKKNPNQL